MASYQFKEYNEETETFETFYERLEQFLILEEAGDEKKKAYLLTLMGSKTYGVLKNLCSPILPKDKTFDNLIDILKRHFSPKRSIVVERFIFFKRMQLKEESISDYLVEIKRLASSCNFGNFLEDSLRDKMVCGLYNAKIQNRILSEGDISLAKVIEIALSMEAAEKNTKLFLLEQGEDCVDKLRMERKVESNFQNGKCKHCEKDFKNSLQHLKLEKASIIVRTYDGTVVPILGKINVKVECQDITYKLRALVVKGEKRALMGREWINRLKLGCFAVKHMPVEITIEEILKENQALFVETTEPIKVTEALDKKVADHLRPYFQRKLELTVDGECLVWGMRVVIPPSLRIKMLNCLHETHSGMNKMKAVARSHFWWPNLDTQIEFLVNKCRSCQQSQDGPNKGKWQPWRWSTRPWQRIHIDFANKENINLLIVVDSHSKWIEAIPMRETTTRKTIEQLRRLFSSYGLPEELVSDNGPQFTGSEMEGFLEGNGIKQTLIPAYHPQRKLGIHTHTIQDTLSKVLLAYRSTPHVTTGKTPSELFIGRALRTRVSLIHPSLASRVRDQQARQMKYDRRTHLEEFQIDDLVWCKNFRGGDKWIPGKIVGKKGTRVYTILIHGQVKAYHRDQIRKRWRNGEEDESGDGERQPEHSRGAGLTSQRSDQDSEVQTDTDDGKSLEPLRSLDPEALKEEGPVLRRNPPRARRPPIRKKKKRTLGEKPGMGIADVEYNIYSASSAKELWVQISGISQLVSKELVESVLNENVDRILSGTLYYKELDLSNTRTKKLTTTGSQNEFIKKLSVFLNVEENQAFGLFCSFLLHEYKGTRSQIKELLCNERNIQLMINKIWNFYCKERIYLLICLKHILSHWKDSNHPYQKLYEKFITTHDKPEDKILNNVVTQLEGLISGPLVDKARNGQYLTESLLQDWSEFRLKEQSELLQILLLYYRVKEPSGAMVIQLLSLFQRNAFGQRQPFRVNPHLHKQHLDLVGHLEVLVFLECLQLDYLLGCSQGNTLVGMLGKHSQHGGALLAWLVVRNMTDPTEDLRELAVLAFRLGAFDSLHSTLVALESHGPVILSLAQNVVYCLLSVLLSRYRLESFGETQKFLKLVENILGNSNIANDVWARGMEHGIGLLLNEMLHQFPLKLAPLLKLLKPLAQASPQSCKKVLELLSQLPVFTQSLDSLPQSSWVQHPQLGCLELTTDIFPYTGENSVHWEVMVNGWDILLLEFNLLCTPSYYISDPAHQVLNILSEFVAATIESDSAAFSKVQPIINKFLGRLPSCCFMSNPPIQFIASCIHLITFLPEEVFEIIWSGLASEHILPCLINSHNSGGEAQFSMGTVGQLIAGVDCVSGTYTLCRSFLQFVLDHLKRIPPTDLTIQGCVAYILHNIFPALFKWKYVNPQEKLQIACRSWTYLGLHTGPQQDVMVWGAISFVSRTPLVVIPGTLTAQRPHTARVTMDCLQSCRTLLWPARLSDLSPIEHIWDVMGRRLQPSRNVDYLTRQLDTIWQEIPQQTIQNFYQSMTRLVAACIQASQACLTIFHTVLSKSFDKKNSQSTLNLFPDFNHSISHRMVKTCLHHLLHGPANQVLLNLVCTGEENLDSVYGQDGIMLVRLSLSILNQLFLHKVASSPESPIMKGNNVVLTIAYYSFQKYSPQLATLAVQLLKRFAKAYPMSLLAFFGTEAESVRDQLLFRLNSAREDIRLKVALLEFLTVCVTSQPGIFEMFINVDMDDKELGELGSCLYSVLDILKNNKQGEVYCPRILHTATVEFVHSLWGGYQMLAIEQLKKQPDAWELMIHPLTSDFSSVSPKTMAYILQTLALEIFYSCTLEGKLDPGLEKLLKKVEDKNLLQTWAQYLEAQLNAPLPQEDLSSTQERDEDLLFLLTAWKTLLTVSYKFSHIAPLQGVTKMSDSLLTSLLQTCHNKMKKDVVQSHLFVLSEIIFTILRSIKSCPAPQLQTWSTSVTEILRNVASISDPSNQPRFLQPLLATVNQMLMMASPSSNGIVAITWGPEEGTAETILADWLEPLLAIYKTTVVVLQSDLKSSTSNLSSPLSSLPLSVAILCCCVLRQVVLQMKDEEIWLRMFQKECIFTSLTNLLLTTLTVKKGLPLAYSLFHLLLTISESRAAADILTNTGVIGTLVLVLPSGQRSEEDSELWQLVIRLVAKLLSKLSYFFLDEALNFVGFHLEALCQALSVVRVKPTAAHLLEVVHIVILFQQLAGLQHAWLLQHPRSQQAVLSAVGQLINTVVSYLMKPLLLQHVLKSLSTGQVSQLDFNPEAEHCTTPAEGTPSKKTSPQLRLINYRLYQILSVSISLLHHFSPQLAKILAQQGHEVPADNVFVLGASFNSPSLDRERPLCFGTLLSAANVCLKFLTKADTSEAFSDPECQIEERCRHHDDYPCLEVMLPQTNTPTLVSAYDFNTIYMKLQEALCQCLV
ncbi:NUP188 [Cordylochernes scorpioides]|uniref:NUP188 n=1 Tax=Cordylochernes scorpioides TaxID=51811 RepID=A0ABY6KIY6_9ARAC|nr:NUP188 [Cordylochernes scorpioides]